MLVAMRQCILMVALLGCAHAAPPWPKPSLSETDGGESLAPRVAKSVVVAKKEPTPDAKPDADSRPSVDTKPAPAPPGASSPPAAPAPVPTPTVEEPDEETIVIEVED